MKRFGLWLIATGALTAGCALGAEDQFIGKAHRDDCDQAVPVCSITAGCRMAEDENYTEFKVPGYRNFVVNTEGEADIVVQTYWRKQISPGTDVEFNFYEPGCVEPRTFSISGEEMFKQIGQDSQWEVKQTVYNGGDHLVELRMDSQGLFLLKVEVIDPIERNAPRGNTDAPEPDFPFP